MHRCHYCGKTLYELPFKCHRCGHIFCRDHHLPENHNCSGHHRHEHTSQKRYCRNCGREIVGRPFICIYCGLIFCDFCGLPENHGCKVTTPDPNPIRGPKMRASLKPLLKKIQESLTLKNFAILSIFLMLIGFLSNYFHVSNYQSIFQSAFEIGILCFFIVYLIYALKCWGATSKIWAALMVSIPLLAYSLATSNIQNSTTNVFLYLAILFCIFVIISAILLYVCDKMKQGIDKFILNKNRGTYRYFLS